MWLRKFGIDISCVKFNVYNLNNEEVAITTSVIIPLSEAEEYLIRAERKENNENVLSEKSKMKNKFLETLQTKIVDELKLDIDTTAMSYRYHYLQIKTPESRVHFEFCFRKKNALEVGIHFEKNNDDRNRLMVEKLHQSHETTLKTSLKDENIRFQSEWNGKKWARIFILNTSGVIDENLLNWAVEKMNILFNILKDEIIYQ